MQLSLFLLASLAVAAPSPSDDAVVVPTKCRNPGLFAPKRKWRKYRECQKVAKQEQEAKVAEQEAKVDQAVYQANVEELKAKGIDPYRRQSTFSLSFSLYNISSAKRDSDENSRVFFASATFNSTNVESKFSWSRVADNDYVANIAFAGPSASNIVAESYIAEDIKGYCANHTKLSNVDCVKAAATEYGLGLIGLGDKSVILVGKSKNLTRDDEVANLLDKLRDGDGYVSQEVVTEAKKWISSTTSPYYTNEPEPQWYCQAVGENKEQRCWFRIFRKNTSTATASKTTSTAFASKTTSTATAPNTASTATASTATASTATDSKTNSDV